MFLGGGPALLCVFRACFVGACVVGSHPWAPVFLFVFMVVLHVQGARFAFVLRVFCARAFVLHVFCECFVNQSESE